MAYTPSDPHPCPSQPLPSDTPLQPHQSPGFGVSDLHGDDLRDEPSDDQLLVALEDLESHLGALNSTPPPCYSTNPPTDLNCISLKALRDSNVTIRKPKKKHFARGRHVNPSLASCIPLSVRLANPSSDSCTPSTVTGAPRDLPPSSGDR